MAVKTLFRKQEVQQFIKEVNSMATLHHKHIIQLYGIVLSQPLMLVSGCGHMLVVGVVLCYWVWSLSHFMLM